MTMLAKPISTYFYSMNVIQKIKKTFFSRPSPKAGRELQTVSDTIKNNEWTLSEKSAGAGHRAVSLHRGCVLV